MTPPNRQTLGVQPLGLNAETVIIVAFMNAKAEDRYSLLKQAYPDLPNDFLHEVARLPDSKKALIRLKFGARSRYNIEVI
mgnify:CR=1 FL=1